MKPLDIIKYVIVALAVGAGAFYMGSCGKKDEIATYISEYKKFQAEAKAAIKMADSLSTKIVIIENEARISQGKAQQASGQVNVLIGKTTDLRKRADSIQQTLTDSIEMARRIIPMKDTIIAEQDSTIKVQAKQVAFLNLTIGKKDTIIGLLKFSNDSLKKVVIHIPAPPPNPNKLFGVIKLPSRTISYIAGIATGAAAVVYATAGR